MWFRGGSGGRHRKTEQKEADKALAEAQKNLEEVRERGGEVSEFSDFFRDFRERNHIQEQLAEILFRKGGPAHGS